VDWRAFEEQLPADCRPFVKQLIAKSRPVELQLRAGLCPRCHLSPERVRVESWGV
jgi:hypothetical protein